MTDLSLLPPLQTQHGTVSVASREQIEQVAAWRQAFAGCRKDYRYYQIVEDTLPQGFDHRYFVLECPQGQVRAIQPFFLLDQDLLQGAGATAQKMVATVRRLLPRALSIRTLMVGCAAGEGHLSFEEHAGWTAECLHAVLARFAKKMKASLVVLKEFPAEYRQSLAPFSSNGYTRVPSLPMTRLAIDFGSFDEYMTKVLSKVTRKSIRRKLKIAASTADPIEMSVVEDVTPFVDEIYPLYLQVFERSKLQFERLTKDYMCRLGSEMPDRALLHLAAEGQGHRLQPLPGPRRFDSRRIPGDGLFGGAGPAPVLPHAARRVAVGDGQELQVVLQQLGRIRP